MSASSTAASASTATAALAKSSAASAERKRPRVSRPGAALHTNSAETKRLATAILEVLAGVRTPTDAAKTLGISLPRYYLLEQRALAGLLAACEPRTKAPGRSVEHACDLGNGVGTENDSRGLRGVGNRPPELIDGRFPFLLSIMDLASRFTLLWSPGPHEDAATVLTHLGELFNVHGAPLVLKCDNGSAFLSESLKAFLTRWLVAGLYSPPRRPQYNGACERNNGCLKSQTHHAASLSAHANWWSSQDTASARATLNTTVRPWGHCGPTPDARWRTREPLSAEQRTNFRTLLATNQREVRLEMNHPLDVVLDHYPQAAVDRVATQRALVTQGLLKVSRSSITLPLKQLKLAKIL